MRADADPRNEVERLIHEAHPELYLWDVVADPGSTVVSFESGLLPRPEASAPVPEAVPLLAIDPAIFRPRLRR